MARSGVRMMLVMVLATVLSTGAAAQSTCTGTLVNLSPCLSYITGNSSTPASECCSRLASLVQSQPQCLCEALRLSGTSVATGLNINETLAIGLPGACNVQTPPISTCNAASPSNSPTGAPESPTSFPTPTGNGSEMVPPVDSSSAEAGSSVKLSISMLFFLLIAGSYASIFSI